MYSFTSKFFKRINKNFILLYFLLLLTGIESPVYAQQSNQEMIVAGFYPYTKDYILKPENIPLSNLTHLIYAFAGPRADGSISTETGSYHNQALVNRVHAEGKKFIIMMGGGLQSGGFHGMASSASTRTIFVNNLADWIRTYGYDGVNIDWEYPGNNNKNEDRENLTLLVQEMRQTFDALETELGKEIEISMDIHSSLYYAQWVDFAALEDDMDWFGLMSYDYSGDWPYSIHVAHNAPLYCGPDSICDRYLSVDLGVKNVRDSLGIPAHKIVMGVAFYGREFFNSELYETPKEGGGAHPYYDIQPLIGNGWTRFWDDQSKVPYLKKNSGTGIMSYDDEQSLTEKTNYIKQNQLAGAMIWEITQDVDKITKQQPLMAVIGENLVGEVVDPTGIPTVAITSPSNDFVFTPGGNLTILANAQVESGFTVQKVDFYGNGSLLGSDNSSPYSYVWQNIPGGKHTLKAIATSSAGKTGESAVIDISDGIVPEYTEMWDDFSYANASDSELGRINSWSIVDGASGPPSGAIYAKEGITFYADPQNSSNKLMGVATTASNDPTKNRHARIETSVMPYRNGTFAARVYFDDTPALYGDANVETFYTINSYATCNNPDLYSEVDFEYLPWDAWHWERKTTMYYTSWETCEIRDHVKTIQSFAGWHDLVYTAAEGQPVKWYIDGQLMGTMPQHTPDSDVNISFANWIYQNTTGSNPTTRTTTMQVDWVYHAKDVVITPQEVLDQVANLRQNQVLRKNLQGEQVIDGNTNPAPTVTITSPANDATFTAPATITISATATDANGSITKVEFFNGNNKLGEDNTSPYNYTWTNIAAGNYVLTARATDNEGASGTSAVVNISVGTNCTAPPVITFTAPSNGASYVAPATITFNADANPGCTNRTITKVDFYNGSVFLGSDNTSPYSYTWANVPEGNYNITATATDSEGGTTNALLSVSVTNTQSSNLALNKPVTVSSLETSAFPGSAAVDGNGSTRWASLYSDPQWIYVDLGANYNINRVKITWEAAYGRDYQVQISGNASDWSSIKTVSGNTALINDHTGLSGSGRYLRIHGTARGTEWGYSIYELEVYGTTGTSNISPTATITSPANNAVFNAPATITLNATASDTDGTISKVEFFNGTNKLGEDLSAPYSFTWTNVAAGSYSLTAKATDNLSASGSSSVVNITVNGNNAPIVNITSPANNAAFNAPATITINATASDGDGSVFKVEFFNGSNKLGEDLSSPYGFTWSNVAVGNYSITAKATDNQGAVATSTPVSVAVNSTTPVQLEAVYNTIAEWGTGFQGEVRVYNHSSTSVTGWTVQFDCPHNLTPIWDAEIVSHTGNHYVIKSIASTQTIAGGQSVVFGFIGNITSGQTFSAPTNFTAQSGTTARISVPENSRKLEVKAYPNPAYGQAFIEFNLEKESKVEISIYKNDGGIATRLINKKMPAGQNKVLWDGSGFGSGVFYYQLKVNNQVITDKILLTK
ncbi:MAG TPA: Ig-like domain-containing protein [Cytophagales bacterium]|nr:Ig-like domain-containing protein [Cytophagales bacterium]